MWRDFVTGQFTASIDAPTQFFADYADLVSQASFQMARRFHRGGRLLVFGNGPATTDAQHVSVEFVHPVIVGKRALPAIALTNDVAAVLGLAQRDGLDEVYAQQVRLLGRREDIALGLTVNVEDASVQRGLAAARALGLLTIAMCGDSDAFADVADFCFPVASADAHVVQEVQETAYHILWETVHVFFDHKGLLEK